MIFSLSKGLPEPEPEVDNSSVDLVDGFVDETKLLHLLSHKLTSRQLEQIIQQINTITDQELLSDICLTAVMPQLRVLAADHLTDEKVRTAKARKVTREILDSNLTVN